jgi:hypothetical protein
MKECDRYLLLMSRQIDGDLTQEEQDELFAHLSVCGHCSARFEVYSAMKLALSELAEEPPAEMARGVMYKIEKDKKRGFGRRFALPFTGLAAAAAVALMIMSGAFGNFGFAALRMGSSGSVAAMDTYGAAQAAPAPAAGAELSDATEAPQAETRSFSGKSVAGSNDGGNSAMLSMVPEATVSPAETDEDSGEKKKVPAVPFSRTFSIIVEISDDTLFTQYERVQSGGQTYIFVPSGELEAYIESQTQENITVFRDGANIDPNVDMGLVIMIG